MPGPEFENGMAELKAPQIFVIHIERFHFD